MQCDPRSNADDARYFDPVPNIAARIGSAESANGDAQSHRAIPAAWRSSPPAVALRPGSTAWRPRGGPAPPQSTSSLARSQAASRTTRQVPFVSSRPTAAGSGVAQNKDFVGSPRNSKSPVIRTCTHKSGSMSAARYYVSSDNCNIAFADLAVGRRCPPFTVVATHWHEDTFVTSADARSRRTRQGRPPGVQRYLRENETRIRVR